MRTRIISLVMVLALVFTLLPVYAIADAVSVTGNDDTTDSQSIDIQDIVGKIPKPDCGCGIKDPLEDLPIAMAYVPWQRWRDLYDSNKGFHRGTIFRDLDKSFCGKGGVCQ